MVGSQEVYMGADTKGQKDKVSTLADNNGSLKTMGGGRQAPALVTRL